MKFHGFKKSIVTHVDGVHKVLRFNDYTDECLGFVVVNVSFLETFKIFTALHKTP